MTPAQCKAARHLLGWTTRRLGEAAEMSQTTIVNFENGRVRTNRATVRMIQATLEAAGVEFLSEGTDDQAPAIKVVLGDGSAVRLRGAAGG